MVSQTKRCLPWLNVVLFLALFIFVLPMNTFRTLVLLFLSNAVIVFAQTAKTPFQESSAQKPVESHLLGKISLGALSQAPYSEWFEKNYNSYSPTTSVIARLTVPNIQKEFSGTKVQIFLGTWCGDSKREVPRLIKVLNKAGMPETALELICVNNADSLYKQSPTHEERGREIYRVPTVIFSQNGKEVGRIVEFPVESLERDVFAVLSHANYAPNYRSFPILQAWLQSGLLADSNVSVSGLSAKLRYAVSTESELNSAAYVLLARGQVQEAITIFRINAQLYPQSSNCFDSLAEGYEKIGNTALAAKYYERALELDSKNAHALGRLIKVKSTL